MTKVKIDVGYYSEDDEQDFLARPGVAGKIGRITSTGVSIDELELIHQGMFNEKKAADGWRTGGELGDRAVERIEWFQQYYRTDGDRLVARYPARDMSSTTEFMGVAAGLATANAVFGCHEADWSRIPVSRTKDLDFRVAVADDQYVAVECKGRICDPSRPGWKQIGQPVKDIRHKKAVQAALRSGVLFGTVATIPIDSDERMKVWLVDPPFETPAMYPRKFKLLSRLRFYWNLIRMIGSPHILIALSTRIRTLDALQDISVLDGVPLVDSRGRTFGVPPSFRTSRSHSVDGKLVFQSIKTELREYFFGMELEVFGAIGRQNHEEILSWAARRPGRNLCEIRRVELRTVSKLKTLAEVANPEGRESIMRKTPSGGVQKCDVVTTRAGFAVGWGEGEGKALAASR